VDTVREPLLILDREFRVVSANRSFYATFQVKRDETENKPLYEDLSRVSWKKKNGVTSVLPNTSPKTAKGELRHVEEYHV